MMPPATYEPGRPAPRWYQKINPLWWLIDDTRPVDSNFWEWNWRNRLHNLFGFVIGVEDRRHTFAGSKVSYSIWAPDGGWNYGVVRCPGWPPLPLISYRGSHIEFYLGWRPIGAFDITIRRSNAKDWSATHPRNP